MNKEQISGRQAVSMLILFLFGSTHVIGTGDQAKADAWIALILAIVLSIPVMLVYSRVLSAYPGRDFFDILNILFGKALGKAVSIFFIWFPFHLGALVLRNFGEFMTTVGLPDTPKIVPMLMLAMLCALAVKLGIETLAKCAGFFILFVIPMAFISTLLIIPKLNMENILPVLENGYQPVLLGTLSAFTFPFGETVVFTALFSSLQRGKSVYKVYLTGLFIAGFILLFGTVRNILVLGAEELSAVYFSSYSVIERINIGNYLQRLEISVSIIFIFSGFVKISVCILAACKGFAKLFGFSDYRFLVIPVTLLMVNLSYIMYENIMEMFEWAFEIYPIYALLFEVILPLLIFAVLEIKMRRNTKLF